jgi:SMC interacting uncharacterized protein involved in chromosome segregation
MDRNIYQIQAEAAKLEREISEIQLEFQLKINEKQAKLQELNVESRILAENFANMQNEISKEEIEKMNNG